MPGSKLYVGNLYCMASGDQIRRLFSRHGRVRRVQMIEGSGYGYVEMASADDALKAKTALDGSSFLERIIRVKEADSSH